MKVTALLTGKGNNTMKDKNIIDILGNPVLFYPAKAGRNSSSITEWYCSSDDNKILDAAFDLGYKKIIRPADMALPSSQHIDCILHALEYMKQLNDVPDILVVLLANNVTVKSEWITECVNILQNNASLSSVVPVYCDNDHHPFRAKTLNDDGTLSMFEKDITYPISTNRQDLPPCFFLAHNFWVLDVKKLLADPHGGQAPWSFMGNRIHPFVIEESIDIHKEEDLYLAREWLLHNYTD